MPAALFGFVAGTALALVMGTIGGPSVGDGFLMLTLALGQALYQFCIQSVARRSPAYNDATFLGVEIADVMNAGLFWPVARVVLVLSTLVLWLAGRSRLGTPCWKSSGRTKSECGSRATAHTGHG